MNFPNENLELLEEDQLEGEEEAKESIQNIKFTSANKKSNTLDSKVIYDPSKEIIQKAKSRQVALSQYMYKNIHMLGFENKARVLNVAIRELMDNSLDACNQNYILPKIYCSIKALKKGYKLIFRDNGPGISSNEVANICGKLLYGSKFGSGYAQKGSQGIGLTSIVLYAQKTKGVSTRIITKQKDTAAVQMDISIDIPKNKPIVKNKKKISQFEHQSGFSIEVDLLSTYTKVGPKSTLELLKQYSYLNPNLQIFFEGPDQTSFKRDPVSKDIIRTSKKCKIVPHHCQIGDIQNLFAKYPQRSLKDLFSTQFEGAYSEYNQLLTQEGISEHLKCKAFNINALTKFVGLFEKNFSNLKPSADQLVDLGPIIVDTVTQQKKIIFDNVINVTSEPIYINKGVLQVQISAFYGGQKSADSKIDVYRVANGTPLVNMGSSCCITKSIIEYNWKKAGFTHIANELPRGQLVLFVHLNGSTIPYINQAKDAIAELPVIKKVIVKSLDLLGKKLNVYMKKLESYQSIEEKTRIVSRVVPELLSALKQTLRRPQDILSLEQKRHLRGNILEMLSVYPHQKGLVIYNHKYPFISFKVLDKTNPHFEKQVKLERGKFEIVQNVRPINMHTEGILNIEYVHLKD